MKFFAVAIAALMGFTDAKSLSGPDMKSRIAKGQLNKKTLMRGAKPYGNTGRKLDADAWEMTGEYSIMFDQCVSLQIENENLIEDPYSTYAEAGTILAEKSYILFKACKTADCYYDTDDQSLTFIVDAGTYVQALADYIPNNREKYCEACEENEDFCLGNYDNADEDQDADEENDQDADEDEDQDEDQDADEDEDERKRKRAMRVLANQKQYIDCDLCSEYECFQEDDEDNQDEYNEEVQYEDALGWLENIAGCNQVEDYTWETTGTSFYAGLICNSAGTGIEIGVFVDEDCEIYLPSKSYSNMMSATEKQYYSKSSELVEYMFKNQFDCNDQDIQYTNAYAEANADEDEDQDDGDDEEEYNLLEACENLWSGDFEPLDLLYCGNNGDDAQEEDEEEAEEDANDEQYYWYTYELSQNDLENGYKVCNVVKSLETSHSNFYDEGNSGSLYDYSVANTSKFSNGAGGLSGGAVAFIVILLVGAAGGAAYVFKGQSKSNKDKKKAPLINGSMA
jgi:hypothetical protein